MFSPYIFLIFHCSLFSLDLVLLFYLTVNYGQDKNYNFIDNIIEVLTQFPDLIKQGLANLSLVQNIQDFLGAESQQLLQ
jgi:predicted small integral membrane protein